MFRVLRWVALLLPLLAAPLQAANEIPFYPLSQGLTWVYAGTVKWPGHSAEVTWKSTVVATFRDQELIAARFLGMPFDLSSYQPGMKPGDYIVVQTRTGFSFAAGAEVPRLWKRLADGHDEVVQDPAFAPLFPFPLLPNPQSADVAKFGGAEQTVGAPRPFDARAVPNAPAGSRSDAVVFPIVFTGNGEHNTFGFVPRLGIASYLDAEGPNQASVKLVRMERAEVAN